MQNMLLLGGRSSGVLLNIWTGGFLVSLNPDRKEDNPVRVELHPKNISCFDGIDNFPSKNDPPPKKTRSSPQKHLPPSPPQKKRVVKTTPPKKIQNTKEPAPTLGSVFSAGRVLGSEDLGFEAMIKACAKAGAAALETEARADLLFLLLFFFSSFFPLFLSSFFFICFSFSGSLSPKYFEVPFFFRFFEAAGPLKP